MDVSLGLFEVLLCGFFGGFAADGLELYRLVKANGGKWPDEWKGLAFALAETIRLAAGIGLAWVFWRSGQISGPLGAVVVGATTPLIVEKFSRSVINNVSGIDLESMIGPTKTLGHHALSIDSKEVIASPSSYEAQQDLSNGSNGV